MHLSLLMYDTVNRNVPSYVSDLFSNAHACKNNPYKSKLRNTECNVVLDHVPKTEYYKSSYSYREIQNFFENVCRRHQFNPCQCRFKSHK